MKPEQINALRAVAKAAMNESRERTKGIKEAGVRDKINAEIITRHYAKITGGYTKIQFMWAIGVVSGRLKEPS